MAEDLTRHSDRLISEGRALVRDNRNGGRHRLGPAIGEGSRKLRQRNLMTRIKLMLAAVATIIVASGVVGLVIDGLGFAGVMVTALAIVSAILIFGQWPKVKLPTRADLSRTQDARALVARTELWLESQRTHLPPAAARLVEEIGRRLDALGTQLADIEPGHPAAAETRKLVGEVLPETIEAYRRIPAHLRREERVGSTPEAQLVESLTRICAEIDRVTRQLAEGSLDDLAVRTRYLEYRYGSAEGVALDLPPVHLPEQQLVEKQ